MSQYSCFIFLFFIQTRAIWGYKTDTGASVTRVLKPVYARPAVGKSKSWPSLGNFHTKWKGILEGRRTNVRLIFVQRWTLKIMAVSAYVGYQCMMLWWILLQRSSLWLQFSNKSSEATCRPGFLEDVTLYFLLGWRASNLMELWSHLASPFSPFPGETSSSLAFFGIFVGYLAPKDGWTHAVPNPFQAEKKHQTKTGAAQNPFTGQRVARLEMPGVDGIHALSGSLMWGLAQDVWHRGWPNGTSRQV